MSESKTCLDVGPFVGPYRIERRLVSGGMAELYLARAPDGMLEFQRTVVVKTLPSSLSSDAHWLSMFYDEARLAARLEHPNLVRVLDLLVDNDRPHIVMEYVDGCDLRTVLQRAVAVGIAWPPGLACHIVAEVLGALAYVHSRRDAHGRSQGLVHRDVSPANIMISFAGAVKLIDFGIAKAAQQLRSEMTAAGQFKGKFCYSSPEQVRCAAVDARTDLFSTGIVLWELMTGRRLFARENHFESLRAILHAPIPPLGLFARDVPPAIEVVVARALAREPAERYSNAEAMRADLEAVIRTQRWPASSMELECLMTSLFATEPKPDTVAPLVAKLSDPTEVATQIDVRCPDPQTTEIVLDRELADVDIEVVEPRSQPTPSEPPLSPALPPSQVLAPLPATTPSVNFSMMAFEGARWLNRPWRSRRRWSRVLIAVVALLVVVGAAVATALRRHIG